MGSIDTQPARVQDGIISGEKQTRSFEMEELELGRKHMAYNL
jgi:hypothetical protein